jgi:ABC-type lipoprotein release transport system permease subunit
MSKGLLYGSVLIFSTIGSYIQVLWHAGFFSLSSIMGGIIGTVVGIWAALKINNYVDF